jgi:plasmid stabilization system protein ParE
MSRFTVIWTDGALNELTQIWLDAGPGPGREAVTAASNAVDEYLAVDPQTRGRPTEEGLRELDIPPLSVLFTVSEEDRTARVVIVRPLTTLPPHPQPNGEVPPTG